MPEVKSNSLIIEFIEVTARSRIGRRECQSTSGSNHSTGNTDKVGQRENNIKPYKAVRTAKLSLDISVDPSKLSAIGEQKDVSAI
jgi:hypothetical protein